MNGWSSFSSLDHVDRAGQGDLTRGGLLRKRNVLRCITEHLKKNILQNTVYFRFGFHEIKFENWQTTC
jgi:hypothetical protein